MSNQPTAPPRISAEQWLARRGYADSRIHSAPAIAALLDEYAAFLATPAPTAYLIAQLEKLSLADPCECDHNTENCCVKVGEPCATCALACVAPTPDDAVSIRAVAKEVMDYFSATHGDGWTFEEVESCLSDLIAIITRAPAPTAEEPTWIRRLAQRIRHHQMKGYIMYTEDQLVASITDEFNKRASESAAPTAEATWQPARR